MMDAARDQLPRVALCYVSRYATVDAETKRSVDDTEQFIHEHIVAFHETGMIACETLVKLGGGRIHGLPIVGERRAIRGAEPIGQASPMSS